MIDPRLSTSHGTAISALGNALGYYRALAAEGLTPAELAEKTITSERFAREWLARQAARGHIDYEPQTGRYFLNDEQRGSLTDSDVDLTPGAYADRSITIRKVQGESGHGRPSPEARPRVLAARLSAVKGFHGAMAIRIAIRLRAAPREP